MQDRTLSCCWLLSVEYYYRANFGESEGVLELRETDVTVPCGADSGYPLGFTQRVMMKLEVEELREEARPRNEPWLHSGNPLWCSHENATNASMTSQTCSLFFCWCKSIR